MNTSGVVAAVFRLERLELLARTQDPVVDLEPLRLQDLLGAYAEGAGVIGQHHAVQGGFAAFGHG